MITKPVVKIQRRTDDLMVVTWIINNICTNACSYCPKNLHTGKNHHYDWENAKRFWQLLLKKHSKLQVALRWRRAHHKSFRFCKNDI